MFFKEKKKICISVIYLHYFIHSKHLKDLSVFLLFVCTDVKRIAEILHFAPALVSKKETSSGP